MSTILNALFPKARSLVLELLFCRPSERFHIREIIRILGIGQGSVQREIDNLVACGLCISVSEGGRRYIQANRNCPVFSEVKGILEKTVGIAVGLEKILSNYPEIKIAFLFGSMARNQERNDSDIDLLIIGEIRFRKIVGLLSPEQRRLGREINPVLYSIEEFRTRVEEKDHFVSELLQTQKEYIIGTEDDFKSMVG